jgi:hypothetical protein
VLDGTANAPRGVQVGACCQGTVCGNRSLGNAQATRFKAPLVRQSSIGAICRSDRRRRPTGECRFRGAQEHQGYARQRLSGCESLPAKAVCSAERLWPVSCVATSTQGGDRVDIYHSRREHLSNSVALVGCADARGAPGAISWYASPYTRTVGLVVWCPFCLVTFTTSQTMIRVARVTDHTRTQPLLRSVKLSTGPSGVLLDVFSGRKGQTAQQRSVCSAQRRRWCAEWESCWHLSRGAPSSG